MRALDRHVGILERTPRVIGAMLGGMDEDLARQRYGEGTFSPFHVVGHLIAGERTDWIPRARIILAEGPRRPFDPFDHQATIEPDEGPALIELLQTFDELRQENLKALRGFQLDDAKLALEGTHPDPAFGRVTLGQLIATWATHDLHHIWQIAKGLAYQQRDEVGPWRAYLRIIPSNEP